MTGIPYIVDDFPCDDACNSETWQKQKLFLATFLSDLSESRHSIAVVHVRVRFFFQHMRRESQVLLSLQRKEASLRFFFVLRLLLDPTGSVRCRVRASLPV